jgi:hypothetical protein
MKTAISLCLAMIGVLAGAPAADRTAWQWEAPIVVKQAGMARLELPASVLDVTRADLGDLRVLSPTGIETPFLIEQPVRRTVVMKDATGFKVVLSGRSTVIEADVGAAGAIEAVELVSPAREFLKSVTLEGRQSGGEWRTLAANEVIFRQAGGAERLVVPVAVGVWEGLRCTVDDERAGPVPFTGVRVKAVGELPATRELKVLLRPGESQPGENQLWLDLGSRNLHVAELRFEVADGVFSRSCNLAIARETPDGKTRLEPIGGEVLYRVAGDRGSSAESLVIPLHRRIAERSLVAGFRNGDSPPLSVTGAWMRYYPTVVVFHAGEAGEWRLLTGNRAASAPDYDLDRLRPALAAAGGQVPVLGPLAAKADYQVPPVLPGVEPAGAAIGLEQWARRRPVELATGGVIRIELDALALASGRTDLGDLRLVQNGRQIPYLVKPERVMREVKPGMVLLPADPKRPTVSRWEIRLPVADVPFVELTARSPAAIFSRRMLALVERSDDLGNSWIETVGEAHWAKSGGVDSPLVIHLGGARLPRTMILETDHGDNPAIPLEDVVLRYAAPSIAAKITGTDPLFLYYGNPKANTPQYDLRLVRGELMAADQQLSVLGGEEILKPHARDSRGIDAGSPWLWLALGGVVVALLVIVAKLLPKAAGNGPDGQRPS